ncbi:MAG: diacylglycerol/lipid kinase family protein [Halanaerobium sp.]
MSKKIIAVINPSAGGGKTASFWPEKSKYLKREFSNFDEVYTKAAGDAVKISNNAVLEGYDFIIAVGGDGTVNEIINGMLSSETEKIESKLIVYPLGTGSDFGRSLNLPTDIEKFIELIKRERSREIKVIEAAYVNYQGQKEKRYFINIADCGMGAEVAKKLNQSPKTLDGSLSYLFKIFQTLFKYQNKKMRVEADSSLIHQGKINSAIIANGSYFGGGIKIAPAADLFNDKINLVLLKDFSKKEIIFNLIKAYKGRHLGHPLVASYLVEKIKITASKPVELEIDGETVGSSDVEFKVSDKRISVLL